MQEKHYIRTKHACYFTYVAMSTVFCLPPMLFVTFRELYGISYTLLGTLVLVNFCTQLAVDLVFTFFNKYFNIHKTVRIMPLLTCTGLMIYAIAPMLMPQYAYAGLLVGTVIFSVSAGLCEVLLSAVVAALPSDTPEKDMSVLHSLFGYGVVLVVAISTVFLKLVGTENWMYLTIFLGLLPLGSFALFCTSPLPQMQVSHSVSAGKGRGRGVGLAICALCIFFGSGAENAMTNWISSFLESALHIPKMLGDTLGLATFALLLAIARTLYAKYGKNIHSVLFWSMVGAAVCYLAAGLCSGVVIPLIACVITGLCTSMLWPGSLILMEEKIPNPGVTAYALMAAGGDFGGSVAPQLQGIVVDTAAASEWASMLGSRLSLSPEQIGMKTGMLVSALFPILGATVLIFAKRFFDKQEKMV